MSEAAAEATGEAQAADQGAQATTAATTETKPAEAAAWDGKIESLPADAQKIIKDLRAEAGDKRTKASSAEQQLLAIQKALNPDSDAKKADPAELTQQLTAQQATARQAQTELAVYKAASKHGADADALLDSRAFLAKIAELDPSKTADIEKAIKDAVTDNPKLKTVQAAGASGANFSGGSGESAKKPTTLAGAVANHYRT
jgi:hypothetical protein